MDPFIFYRTAYSQKRGGWCVWTADENRQMLKYVSGPYDDEASADIERQKLNEDQIEINPDDLAWQPVGELT